VYVGVAEHKDLAKYSLHMLVRRCTRAAAETVCIVPVTVRVVTPSARAHAQLTMRCPAG
jgi:hypothetical protein